MKLSFIESVYLTLIGELTLDHSVPGVENLFADGLDCDRLYHEMWEAYQHFLDKFGLIDADDDVEIVINSLLRICEIVGYGMYRCGAKFGNLDQAE